MKLDIVEEKKHAILHRTDLVLEIEQKNTPTRKELLQAIASKKGTDAGLVVIEKVGNPFGQTRVRVHARIYDSAEHVKKSPQFLIHRTIGKPAKEEKK